MFWFAPLIGAAITAIIYEYAPLKPKKREGKENMEAAIFLATKKRGEALDDGEEEGDYEENTGNNQRRQQLSTEDEDYDPTL